MSRSTRSKQIAKLSNLHQKRSNPPDDLLCPAVLRAVRSSELSLHDHSRGEIVSSAKLRSERSSFDPHRYTSIGRWLACVLSRNVISSDRFVFQSDGDLSRDDRRCSVCLWISGDRHSPQSSRMPTNVHGWIERRERETLFQGLSLQWKPKNFSVHISLFFLHTHTLTCLSNSGGFQRQQKPDRLNCNSSGVSNRPCLFSRRENERLGVLNTLFFLEKKPIQSDRKIIIQTRERKNTGFRRTVSQDTICYGNEDRHE